MPKITLKYKMPHRRRRMQKTDYRKRFALLKSGKIRLVVRKSLNNMIVQFIRYEPKGDNTLVSACSKKLGDFGWKSGGGNVPAAYLTGLMAGVKAKKAGVKEAIADIGIQTSTKGSRIYAAIKGVIDSGISINCSKDILPSEDRLLGKHIKPEFETLVKTVKEKILKM